MPGGGTFDEASLRRIARSVLLTEGLPLVRAQAGRGQRPSFHQPLLVKATAAVATGSSGTFNAVSLANVTVTEHTAAADQFTCWNLFGTRIWDDSLCVAEYLGGTLVVTRSNAATMLRGLLTADLASTDTSRTLDNLNALNGHYPIVDATTTVTGQNVFEWDGDDNGVATVVWNDEDAQWELLEVACSASA